MTLRLEPAGFLWLVRHEMRVTYRSSGRASLLKRAVPFLLLLTLPCIAGPFIAFQLRDVVDQRAAVLGFVALLNAGMLVMFVSTASPLVLRSFNERADLDLLLAAPISPSRILAAKSVAIYAAVVLPSLILLLPFLITSAALGHPEWFAALPVVIVTAIVATSLAFGFVRLLFLLVEPRRARTILQIAGGLLGAAVFLLGQAYAGVPAFSAAIGRIAAHAPPPPLDAAARATFGDPAALLELVVFALACAWASSRLAAASLTATDSPMRALPPPKVAAAPFKSGTMRIIVVKELRSIARDPELLSQLTLQLVYMLPVAVLILSGSDMGNTVGSRGAAACTLFAGLLASNLSWLIICSEDAPELLAAAPVAPSTVAWAKLIAACAPPLTVVVLLAAVLAVHHPWPALIAVMTSTGAAVSASLLQGWFGKPQRRSAFRRRQRGSLLLALGEFAIISGWSGTAAMLARNSPWAAAPAIFVAVIMAALASARPRDGIGTARTAFVVNRQQAAA